MYQVCLAHWNNKCLNSCLECIKQVKKKRNSLNISYCQNSITGGMSSSRVENTNKKKLGFKNGRRGQSNKACYGAYSGAAAK